MVLAKKWHSGTFALALGLLTLCPLAAQRPPAVSSAVEASIYRAFLWGHTPRLTIRTGHVVWSHEVGILWPTWGRREWEAWRQYPLWGLSACYFSLGEGAHTAAWGLLPSLHIPLWRNHRWMAAFRIGTGLGYVVRPYDSVTHPTENAVGSHWNNLTQFRLGLTYRLSKHWRLQAGTALTHLSNGAAKLPNFGINLPGYFFSVVGSARGIEEAQFLPATTSRRAIARWGAMVGGAFAHLEYAVVDGPKYRLWGASLTSLFHLNRLNRLTLTAEGEYNSAVALFGLQTGAFRSAAEARRGAYRFALAPGAEFLFGPVGIHLQAGVYIGGPAINRFAAAPWYSRLTTRYYFPLLGRAPLRPWVGLGLKAHRVNAEMIALQFGVALSREK